MEKRKQLQLRHELKHFINHIDYVELSSKLKHVMQHDANSDINGRYLVRSLYFDNFEDKVLREKINGNPCREKFRIRLYNGDTNIIKLEKKSKIYGLCAKESVNISAAQCERLLAGDINVLKEMEHPLSLELYAKMNYQCIRPKSIVEYEREAYTYPPGNVRITFDSKIIYSTHVQTFLTGSSDGFTPAKETVLEIKFDAFLPQVIRDITQLNSRQVTAFSKYATARRL